MKHTRSHVGMNTYKCDQCPAAFRLHGELRIHRQQHFQQQKGILGGDQSSQESFVGNEIEKDANNINHEFHSILDDSTKREEVRFEMVQLASTNKQPEQQPMSDAHFMTHN